ncbi:MAG TPA: hypothetical protein VJ023_03150 [Pyrinomonadaceae bacterium]|nr:hypothetical protein [Pyrinomonadaceae bacterium]
MSVLLQPMSPRRKLGKKLVKSLLPIALVLLLALTLAIAAIVYGVTRPPRRAYLVTPDAFRQISGPVLGVSDQIWTNLDGSTARGWLLRGTEGSPAVVFLHRYGADRSWLFNLGVKLNESVGYTILWPDLRGHGLDPPVSSSTFGGREVQDLLGALDYLRALKSPGGSRLIANRIGVYGVELGGYAALGAASQDAEIQVLVLDSVPESPDQLLRAAVLEDYELDNDLLNSLTRTATRIYLSGKYVSTPSCDLAAAARTQRILLLSGNDAGHLQDASVTLKNCFSDQSRVEAITDLPLTGFRLPSATGEQAEGYDRRVIEFFARSLQ